jgi:hypothetical protein
MGKERRVELAWRALFHQTRGKVVGESLLDWRSLEYSCVSITCFTTPHRNLVSITSRKLFKNSSHLTSVLEFGDIEIVLESDWKGARHCSGPCDKLFWVDLEHLHLVLSLKPTWAYGFNRNRVEASFGWRVHGGLWHTR